MKLLSDVRAEYPQYNDISDKDFADALYNKFYSDMPQEEYYSAIGFAQEQPAVTPEDNEGLTLSDFGEGAKEYGKSIVRGFGSGLLSAGSGLAELADVATDRIGLEDLIDSGDENELIRLANSGQEFLQDNFGVSDAYKDSWLTMFGEGVGSIGSFLVPGGAIGMAGRAAGLTKGAIKTAQTVAAATQGGGLGAAEQAARVEQSRARGVDVSEDQADASIALGALVGTSEAFAPLEILKKIRFLRDPATSNKAFDMVSSALKTGTIEGAQEVAASLMQDAIQLGVYDENIPVGESLWDEFTVGAAAGALVDAATTGMFRRRGGLSRDVERQREELIRQEEERQREKYFTDLEINEQAAIEKEIQRQIAQQEAAALDEEQARKDIADFQTRMSEQYRAEQEAKLNEPYAASRDAKTVAQQGKEYAEQLSRNASIRSGLFPETGRFDIREELAGPQGTLFSVYNTADGKVYGQPTNDLEFAKHLTLGLNNEMVNRNVNRGIIEAMDLAPESYDPQTSETIYAVGQRLNRPKSYTISEATLNEAAGTVQTPDSPYLENLSLDQIHQIQYGVPPFQDGKKKLYKDMKNLTMSQQINLERARKGLPPLREFTLAEAKDALGDKYDKVFDVLLDVQQPDMQKIREEFGEAGVNVQGGRQRYQDEVNTRREVETTLNNKNIISPINSKEIKYVFKKITGEQSIDKMSPSQRMYLVGELKKMPTLAEPAKLPDFTPRPYTRKDFDNAMSRVTSTGDGTLENIKEAMPEGLTERRKSTMANLIRAELLTRGVINKDGSVSELAALPDLRPAPTEKAPIVQPDFTVKQSEQALAFESELNKKLKGMGLDDIRLKVLDQIREIGVTREGRAIEVAQKRDVSRAEGFFDQRSRTIVLSLDSAMQAARDNSPEAFDFALNDVLNHETVHALRNLDLWTQKEWSLLENAAKKLVVPGQGNKTFFQDASERYTDLSPVGRMEEAVAELIRYSKRDRSIIGGKPRTLIDRMFEFFRRMASAVKGTGFNTLNDLLDNIESGGLGARERGVVRTARATERLMGAVPARGIGRDIDMVDIPIDETIQEARMDRSDIGFGLSQWENSNFALVGGYRDGSSSPGETRLRYEVYDVPMAAQKGPEAAKIGYTVLRTRDSDGAILGLIDVKLDPKYRKMGYGKQLVQDIVDSTESGLDIHDIKKSAQRFWSKAGTQFKDRMKTEGRIPRAVAAPEDNAIQMSVRRAAELSKEKYDDYSTSLEEEFFGKHWPKLLKQSGGTGSPKRVRVAAKKALADISDWVKENPKFNDYYNEDMKAVRAALETKYGQITDEDMLFYQVANGLTSPATKLSSNVGDALKTFELYKNKGNLDDIVLGVSEKGNTVVKSSPFKLSGATQPTKARSLKVFDRQIQERGGIKQAVDYLSEGVSVKDLQKFNREMGYKTPVKDIGAIKSLVKEATGQDQKIPRMFIFGKKIGAYTLNLTGNSKYTTIDVWESRFIRSYFNGLFEKNTGLPATVDEDTLFQDFSRVFKEEFDKIAGYDVDPSTLQAMRWFYMINAAKQAGYRGASTNETISELTAKKIGASRKGRTGRGAQGDAAVAQEIRSAIEAPATDEISLSLKRLDGMPESFEVNGQAVEFGYFDKAVETAKKYSERAGIEYVPLTTYAPINEDVAKKIAAEFELMKHDPENPEVIAAYQAMIDETKEQYKDILDTGLEVQFIKGDDPYGNPRNVILDVINNNHMWVFSTRDGFGSNAEMDTSDNPLLQETEFVTADGDPMLANDLFRVVHDYFGHIKNGVGFRARGEENAWQAHASMYSPLARRAMTTETRGQNSYVNFGPNREFNKTASGADTIYSDQKVGLLPLWVSEEGRLSDAKRRSNRVFQEGLEGAIRDDGRLSLTHFSRRPINRTDPSKAGTGLDRTRRYSPKGTYFGITEAVDDGYVKESGLGSVENKFSVDPVTLYPLEKDPDGLIVRHPAGNLDYPSTTDNLKANGYIGFWTNSDIGKVAFITEPLIADNVSDQIMGIDQGDIVESRRRVDEVINRTPEGSMLNIYDSEVTRPFIEEQESNGRLPFSWQAKTYSVGDKIIYQAADKLVGLKNAEEQINAARRAAGLPPIANKDSAYVGEESIPGKIGIEIKDFQENVQRPLARKIANNNLTIEEVDEFLTFRHAIERNNRIALRDQSRNVETNPGSGSLKTGDRLSNSFVKATMRRKYGLEWNDATETWEGGNERARKLLDVASDIDRITQQTTDRLVSGGLLSRENGEALKRLYKYYAPLKGKAQEDDLADLVAVSSGLSTKGKEYMRAFGRESAAESPLGHIMLNAERAISRAVKNQSFGERLVNLIKANPNEDFWEVYSEDNPRFKMAFDKYYTYIGSDPAMQGQRFKEIPQGMSSRDFVQYSTFNKDGLLKLDNDLIGAKIGGKEYFIDIKDDRLRRAIQSVNAGEAANALRKFSMINRWLSMMNTSLNPEFVIGNFSRDLQTAIYNVIGEQTMTGGKIKDQKRIVRRILKDVIPSMGAVYKGMRRYDIKDGTLRGSTGMSQQDYNDFREFMESGAKADWFYNRPAEEQAQTIENMVDMERGTFSGNFRRRYENIRDFVEDANASVENAVRFAAFKAARDELLDSGVSRDEAVATASTLAKNLTVNFNRKGMQGDLLNSLFLFYNASVQGTLNFARGLNVFDPGSSRMKQGMVASMIGFGALMALKAEEESEENPDTGRSYYSEIPDYVKERNIVIMKENGKDYYTIPLPYGYNVFHVAGSKLYEMKSDLISPVKAASDLTSAFMGSFSPIGFFPLPTVTQPFWEIAKNENYFGSPIYKENFPTGTQVPASQLAMSTTRTPFKVAAKILNGLTGGNEYESGYIDISPDALEHIAEFAFGGAGTFGLRNMNALEKWAKGEELETREMPFIRRIMGEPNEQMSMSDYYDRKVKLEQKQAALEGYRGAERLQYRNRNKDYITMFNLLDQSERQLRQLRKARSEIRTAAALSPANAKAYAEREEQIEDAIQKIYDRFNKYYDQRVGRTK